MRWPRPVSTVFVLGSPDTHFWGSGMGPLSHWNSMWTHVESPFHVGEDGMRTWNVGYARSGGVETRRLVHGELVRDDFGDGVICDGVHRRRWLGVMVVEGGVESDLSGGVMWEFGDVVTHSVMTVESNGVTWEGGSWVKGDKQHVSAVGEGVVVDWESDDKCENGRVRGEASEGHYEANNRGTEGKGEGGKRSNSWCEKARHLAHSVGQTVAERERGGGRGGGRGKEREITSLTLSLAHTPGGAWVEAR